MAPMRASPTVASIFHDAQLSFAKHRRCTETLHALRAAATDKEQFDNQIFQCVACILPMPKREASAERVVEFMVHFATNNGGEAALDEDFVDRLCLRLIRLASSKNKAVRFRVVQLIGRMLDAMGEEVDVSDDLFDAVESAMLTRCQDKEPIVRAWAIKALFRLQNPQDPSDEVTSELLRLMNEDSAKEVRMAAVSTVAPSKASIRALLLRVRDTSPDVRLHALTVLTHKVEMRWLSISQRVHLVEGTLRDRTSAVAAKGAEMVVGSWLHRGCDGDVLALLRALDSVSNPHAANLVLETLVAHETANIQVEHAKSTSTLCHLARAAAYCDTRSNEAGRAALETLCRQLLQAPTTPDEALGDIFFALQSACLSFSGYSAPFQRSVLELISDVEQPVEDDCAAEDDDAGARLQREQDILLNSERLGQLRTKLQAAVAGEDFDEAAALQKEAAAVAESLAQLEKAHGGLAPEVESARTARALRLSALLLQAPRLALAEFEIENLPSRFEPALKSPQVELRELAVKCYGLVAHTSAARARKVFPLLTTALQHDQPAVQLAALHATLDLLLVHTPAAVLPPHHALEAIAPSTAALASAIDSGAPAVAIEDAHAEQVSSLLAPIFERSSGALRKAAALGACKLLHADALRSPSLLARLLLACYETSEEWAADAIARRDAAELNQALSVFFSASGRRAGADVALLPAMRIALAAAPGARASTVAVDELISFVLGLTSADASDADDATQLDLALGLCCEGLRVASEGYDGPIDTKEALRAVSRGLGHVHMPARASEGSCRSMETLSDLLTRLLPLVEKNSTRHVHKLRERVSAALQADDVAEVGTGDTSAPATVKAETAPSPEAVLAAHVAAAAAFEDRALALSARHEEERRESLATFSASSEDVPGGKKGGKPGPARRKLTKTSSKAIGGLTPAKTPSSENMAGNIVS